MSILPSLVAVSLAPGSTPSIPNAVSGCQLRASYWLFPTPVVLVSPTACPPWEHTSSSRLLPRLLPRTPPAPLLRGTARQGRMQDASRCPCSPSTSPSALVPGTSALSLGVNYARALAAIKTLLLLLCPSCNNSCRRAQEARRRGFGQQGLPGELFQGREFLGGGNPIPLSLPVPKHAVTLLSRCPRGSGSGCQGNSWCGGSGVPGSAGLLGGGLAGIWPSGGVLGLQEAVSDGIAHHGFMAQPGRGFRGCPGPAELPVCSLDGTSSAPPSASPSGLHRYGAVPREEPGR